MATQSAWGMQQGGLVVAGHSENHTALDAEFAQARIDRTCELAAWRHQHVLHPAIRFQVQLRSSAGMPFALSHAKRIVEQWSLL